MASSNAPAPGEYEFTHLENQTVEKTASWAKILAIVLFVDGGLSVVGQDIVGAVVSIIVGLMFYNAAKHLKLVVDTEGNDVTNLMSALKKVNTAFTIRIVLMALAAGVLLIAGVILGLVLAAG